MFSGVGKLLSYLLKSEEAGDTDDAADGKLLEYFQYLNIFEIC